MDLYSVEQQRQTLEDSLQKLRAALRTWQAWEAEYEGLKEEIEAVPSGVTPSILSNISKTYNGSLVDEKEIRDLAGLGKGAPPSASQIVSRISRRQEYVQKNIETVQRQFWDAEAKLEEFDFAAFSANREGGLPLTEINEELDDDDNVVSSNLSQPEVDGSQIFDTLRKAGLSEDDLQNTPAQRPAEQQPVDKPTKPALATVPIPASSESSSKSTMDISKPIGSPERVDSSPARPPIRKKSVSFTADTKVIEEPIRPDSEDGKKTVSFAEKVAIAPAAPPPDNRSVSFAASVEEIPAHSGASGSSEVKSDSELQKNLRASFKPGEKVYELADDDTLAATHVVMPEGESEEDAATRREMVNYHLHEVGHIVAQLEVDDGEQEDEMDVDDATSASDFANSERPDEDTPYTSVHSESEDDDEDEYGRSTKPAISEAYRKRMEELQSKLIGNLGPAPTSQDLDAVDSQIDPDDVHRLVIREKRNSTSSQSSESSKRSGGKKRVSFAQALDVAEPPPPPKAQKVSESEVEVPIAGMVTERKSSGPRSSSFGSSTATVDDDQPFSGPSGTIMADRLKERQIVNRPAHAPSADDPDPVMQRRELAETYYKHRNDMIRQQGGFKANDDADDEHGELMEERDGKLKKVSRFKAARIRPS